MYSCGPVLQLLKGPFLLSSAPRAYTSSVGQVDADQFLSCIRCCLSRCCNVFPSAHWPLAGASKYFSCTVFCGFMTCSHLL